MMNEIKHIKILSLNYFFLVIAPLLLKYKEVL